MSSIFVRHLLLLCFVPSVALSQLLSHPLSLAPASPPSGRITTLPDTVRILAAMVQFQTDADKGTTGDGKFLTAPEQDSTIDAAPHNRQYFEAHLTFLRNYFDKASKGKLVVVGTVVDQVFTLPTVLSTYGKPAGADSLLPNLARDTWQLVDASGLVPDFSRYQCFMVFHAGAGKDIDMTAILGYDPTPLDIPSIYLSLNALRKAYGTGYLGIPVNGGAFRITNSAILPETESRFLPTVQGQSYLELGINGLLCATLGSHLGLPDLFDTKTGKSGIGRFGLMDGQSIFSFSGVFPPEPSAWEKLRLGWVTPVDLPPGETTIPLGSVSTGGSVYRVRFSADEYFLLENRNRDPLRNGETVTSVYNGVTRTQLFPRDTVGFDAFDISKLAGVVTDVEDLDWSLPGGVSDVGEFFDGGILIWHIDEGVIENGIPTNTVNADPAHRGVDLEEADGSQDIGQVYEGLFAAGSGSESGTALDFWYAGNSSPVNKNVFSSSTFPDSRSSTGAQSHVTVRNFSLRGPSMTATVINGDSLFSLVQGFPRQTGRLLTPHCLKSGVLGSSPGAWAIVVTTSDSLTDGSPSSGQILALPTIGVQSLSGFRSDGVVAIATGKGFTTHAALVDVDNDIVNEILVGQNISAMTFSLKSPGADSLAVPLNNVSFGGPSSGEPVISSPVIGYPGPSGKAYFLPLDGSTFDSLQLPGSPASIRLSRSGATRGFLITTSSGLLARTVRDASGRQVGSLQSAQFNGSIAGSAVVGWFKPGGKDVLCYVFVKNGNEVCVVDTHFTLLPGFPLQLSEPAAEDQLALGDIDNDGSRDIIVLTRTQVVAVNVAGAMLDHFPVSLVTAPDYLSSNPVVADVDGDFRPEIVAATSDGRVCALNKRGEMVSGFPLAAGGCGIALAFTNRGSPTNAALALATREGNVSLWSMSDNLSNKSQQPWPESGHDQLNGYLDSSIPSGSSVIADFFPQDRAYNWPNPVYDGKTYIRYFVKSDAQIHIKIFDIAGDLVTSFDGPGAGGMDNEVMWNASGVQSGVYLAHIEASGAGGSGHAVVKIAVVR